MQDDQTFPVPRLLDGKHLATVLRSRMAEQVAGLPFRPGLAVVLVGENPASTVYVRNKDHAAKAVGLDVRTIHLPAASTEAELLAVVHRLNNDPAVDGILVQMPLPAQIRTAAVMDAIDPAKDVDGLTLLNAGRLADGRKGLVPCTPKGVMKLLDHAGCSLAGAHAVVLGRSALVGRPVAALLLAANATVTIVHSRTASPERLCCQADVLVAAVGQPELVKGDWIKPGAVVIDVGINRTMEGGLVGDVAFKECSAKAAAITPVPGGVGPMTIACLLENTIQAALDRRNEASTPKITEPFC